MRRLSVLLLVLTSCATQPAPAPAPIAAAPAKSDCGAGLSILNGTLWIQSAAEYQASATQIYATARRQLDATLAEPSNLPPAIILDVDETIVDNMAFETRMIKKGITYDGDDWTAWVNESAARAIPGAYEFLTYARSRGVTPFYITNRKVAEKEGTRRNLEKLGYPLSATEDTLLVQGQRKEWEVSDKSPRRDWVGSRYRVLLVLGDDLNDFVDAHDKDNAARDELVRSNSAMWGTRWLILPNPIYGSWERAITGRGTECEKLQKKLESLR